MKHPLSFGGGRPASRLSRAWDRQQVEVKASIEHPLKPLRVLEFASSSRILRFGIPVLVSILEGILV